MDFEKKNLNSIGIKLIDMRIVSVLIIVFYIIIYFYIPATPGNSPYAHPLGWWGWFDQGQYLLSANALAQGDFTPNKHFYPPLYPAIGAIFLKWSSGHSFFIFNLAALIFFVYVFLRFADRYIPRWGSVVLIFSSTIFNYTLFENYVIPWTSTLSVALLSSGILGLVWLNEVRDGIRPRISGLQVFFVATCLGLIVPTRPADAVVGALIGLGLLISYWRVRRNAIESVPRTSYFIFLAMAGVVIGPLLFLSFNTAVFGSPFGNYIQVAGANGFFFTDLAEKFVSLWLDGFTLYGEQNADLTEHYPWLFLSLAGLTWVLICGDGLLRLVALSIVLLFILYMPYGDLLPNGLWRFLNINYFKWTFPFLALFAVLLVKQVLVAWHKKQGRLLPNFLLVGIPFLLLSLHFVVDVTSVSVRIKNNSENIIFELPPNKQVDLIDIKGISGSFTEIYFGSHHLLLDGRELKVVRDYRLLPMIWGVRLLFIRPVVGRSIEFLPSKNLTRHTGSLSAQLGVYHFAFGVLKPFRQPNQYEIVTDYHLGEIIDFSERGSGGLYLTDGWSAPEAWGRWSINGKAGIQMRVTDHENHALDLELIIGAFVSESHPCQDVKILVNEKVVAKQLLCVGKGGEKTLPYKFFLGRELLRPDGKIDIRFITPNSISPKTLGISADDRVLGVGIKSLKFVANKN